MAVVSLQREELALSYFGIGSQEKWCVGCQRHKHQPSQLTLMDRLVCYFKLQPLLLHHPLWSRRIHAKSKEVRVVKMHESYHFRNR
jgi:hypothetical protein